MHPKPSWHNLTWSFIFLSAWLALVACSPLRAGPQAWLDYPKDGSLLSMDKPITVLAHVFASEGIADVLLTVNGVAYRRNPPTKTGDLLTSAHEWTPERAGEYTLEIIAYSASGAASSPARARVRVIGKTTPTPTRAVTTTPTPVANISATPVANISPTRVSAADLELLSVEPIIVLTKGDTPFCDIRVTYRNAGTIPIPNDYTIQAYLDGRSHATINRGRGFGVGGTSEAIFVYQFTGTAYIGITLDATNAITESNEANNAFAEARTCTATAGSVTPSPTIALPVITLVPTRTPTGIMPAQINFRADQTNITRGQCTTLRWDIENATAVYLDGNGVQGHSAQQVCPNNSTTYTLRVTTATGNIDRQITITVQVPANTATPTRTPTKVPDTQAPPAPSLVSPSGTLSCRTSVTLDWNAVSDASGIKTYYVKLERQISAGNWQSAGGWTTSNTAQSVSVQCGGIYRWQVRAEDNAGNQGPWSGFMNFSINLP